MANNEPCAVISGGGGYLGRAVQDALTTRNWRSVALGRASVAGIDSVACDITDAQSVNDAIATIMRTHGRIDACIHAAAASLARVPLMDVAPDAFDHDLAVAARGAFLLARVLQPHLPSAAAFIGVTSEAIEPEERTLRMGAYVPAKYALRGVLKSLSVERSDLRVYAVAPGFLPGGLNADLPQALRERYAEEYGSTLEDIAAFMADLVQTDADRYPSGNSYTLPGPTATPL